jgi:HK97 family phage portal protein
MTKRVAKTKIEERAITSQSFGGILGSPGYSGIPVTEQTALGLSALSCGIRVISEAVGSLPPVLYKVTENNTKRQPNHPLSLVLKNPNPEATRPVLWESFVATGLMYGNGFLEIVRDQSGRCIEIWNLHPQHVQVLRDSVTGRLVYRVTNSMSGGPGGQAGTQTQLTSDDIIHVPFNITPDGSVGYRLLNLARDTIGFGLAAQRYGCSLFRNMGRPAGMIEVPCSIKLNEDGRENLRKSFTSNHAGENVGTVGIMEQGLTFTSIDLATNEQTQYQQLLTFFVYEVARLLNIPPFKLHSLDSATWNNSAAQQEAFLSTTLRPLLEKLECELEKKLLMPSEQGSFDIEFDTHELLRADKPTRYTTYETALQGAAFLTINEVRAEEGYPPIDGGDELPTALAPTPAQQQPNQDQQDQQDQQDKGDNQAEQGDE